MKEMGLSDLRKKIDELDSQILGLLNRRAELVIQIGREKERRQMGFFAPDREEEIHRRLASLNRGPLPDRVLHAIYREILSGCLSLEKPLQVAYLGPPATFTHIASMKRFGASAQFLPLKGIGEVFAEVEKGNADFGVVPVENSTEGMINHTLDMFVDSDLKICGEVFLEVSHHLLGVAERIEGIERVYSHPQALAQSRRWLEANLSHAELIEVFSTAAAAEMAAKDPGGAAIASELAADLYGLRKIQSRIEDCAKNYTRFMVIGNHYGPRTGKDKTSILFSIKDQVGALYRILKPFADRGINLTSIESRPSRIRTWDYIFYVDFEGYVEDPQVQEILPHVQAECSMLKVLGSYPKGIYY
ncbi:MAG: prephenate dehydratase [candidate division NC10 bacterium]|nr:prephenate dehydratase [candidate division NC10 bacterium]